MFIEQTLKLEKINWTKTLHPVLQKTRKIIFFFLKKEVKVSPSKKVK